MSIIAKLSLWIMKPTTQLTENSFTPFEQVIMDALAQFTREGYVEKLRTSITSLSLPSDKEDVLAFLYNQATHT
ncbi:hypothetical protein AX14_006168 [Amanita brunnescens Koide BX004]|nr:hypothetical protein AX14_006168 [Amanita brunnescens Koide BX004]